MEAVTRMADRPGASLLASAADGDEVAFRHIIARHHEDMRRVAAYVHAFPERFQTNVYSMWAYTEPFCTPSASARSPIDVPW